MAPNVNAPSPEPSRWRPLAAVLGTVLGLATLLSLIVIMTLVGKTVVVDDSQARAIKLTEHQAANQQTLQSYGWVDQKAGVVRIPIEQAMEKLIAENK